MINCQIRVCATVHDQTWDRPHNLLTLFRHIRCLEVTAYDICHVLEMTAARMTIFKANDKHTTKRSMLTLDLPDTPGPKRRSELVPPCCSWPRQGLHKRQQHPTSLADHTLCCRLHSWNGKTFIGWAWHNIMQKDVSPCLRWLQAFGQS